MSDQEPQTASITVPSIRLVGEFYRDVTVTRSQYLSDPDTLALVANTADGEPLAAFSVNIVGDPPSPGCVWVKTWSEGEGVLEQLERLGVLRRTGRTAKAGFAVAREARLLGGLAVQDYSGPEHDQAEGRGIVPPYLEKRAGDRLEERKKDG